MSKYGHLGFRLVAFPTNQFAADAPGSSECERAFMHFKVPPNNHTGVEPYAVFDKESPSGEPLIVNGPGTHPLWFFLKMATPSPKGGLLDVPWTWTSYLVGKNGQPLEQFLPERSPLEAEDQIRELLGLPPLSAEAVAERIKRMDAALVNLNRTAGSKYHRKVCHEEGNTTHEEGAW